MNDKLVAMPTKFPFAEKVVKLTDGSEWRMRELSVGENDTCADGAKKPDGDIDGRAMMRLMIAKSAVEPTLTLDELLAMPNRVYIKFAEAVNELNSPDYDEETEAKND